MRPSRACASTRTEPPSGLRATACFTLFSTRDCTAKSGTSVDSSPAGTLNEKRSRSPNRTRSNLEVVGDELHLPPERYQKLRIGFERCVQQRREPLDDALGRSGVVGDEREGGVEAVEEKVRTHARLERRQARLEREALGPHPVDLGLVERGRRRALELPQSVERQHQQADQQRQHARDRGARKPPDDEGAGAARATGREQDGPRTQAPQKRQGEQRGDEDRPAA